MSLLDLSTLLVCVTAALAFVNARFLRLPASIGVTVGGLLLSLVLLVLVALNVPFALAVVELVKGVQFDDFVFQGVLSFLLFAGALSVDSHALWTLRAPVLAFALLSTLLSIGLIGGALYGLLPLFGLTLPLVACLLFGALISPTDPVAVLGMLKQARVPKRIETLVAGESLLNDGVGVVAFAVLAGLATAGGGLHAADPHAESGALAVLGLFAREALGGLLLGGVLGLAGYLALRTVHDFVVEVLLTLGVVLACTAVAAHLGVSAPLAAVAAGLLVGSLTERRPAALSSREKFDAFWHLTDELLNIFLFALLALEVVVVPFGAAPLLIGGLTIPLLLVVRTISVQVPVWLLRRYAFPPYTRRLMVWGGLRGAISVALAFTVPSGPTRDLFLVLTYVVVLFSIVVQGLTVGRLATGAAAPTGRS